MTAESSLNVTASTMNASSALPRKSRTGNSLPSSGQSACSIRFAKYPSDLSSGILEAMLRTRRRIFSFGVGPFCFFLPWKSSLRALCSEKYSMRFCRFCLRRACIMMKEESTRNVNATVKTASNAFIHSSIH